MNPVRKDSYTFNPEDNGGESLHVTIEYFDNGDSRHGLDAGIFTNETLTLQSYGNSASFNLTSVLTPEALRELANLIENGRELALRLAVAPKVGQP